jgi:hypothetical protein
LRELDEFSEVIGALLLGLVRRIWQPFYGSAPGVIFQRRGQSATLACSFFILEQATLCGKVPSNAILYFFDAELIG